MISGFSSSAVDRGFELTSDQNKDYNIDICYLTKLEIFLFWR